MVFPFFHPQCEAEKPEEQRAARKEFGGCANGAGADESSRGRSAGRRARALRPHARTVRERRLYMVPRKIRLSPPKPSIPTIQHHTPVHEDLLPPHIRSACAPKLAREQSRGADTDVGAGSQA